LGRGGKKYATASTSLSLLVIVEIVEQYFPDVETIQSRLQSLTGVGRDYDANANFSSSLYAAEKKSDKRNAEDDDAFFATISQFQFLAYKKQEKENIRAALPPKKIVLIRNENINDKDDDDGAQQSDLKATSPSRSELLKKFCDKFSGKLDKDVIESVIDYSFPNVHEIEETLSKMQS
jgi:Mg2+ and Co2+ transporter CorA